MPSYITQSKRVNLPGKHKLPAPAINGRLSETLLFASTCRDGSVAPGIQGPYLETELIPQLMPDKDVLVEKSWILDAQTQFLVPAG